MKIWGPYWAHSRKTMVKTCWTGHLPTYLGPHASVPTTIRVCSPSIQVVGLGEGVESEKLNGLEHLVETMAFPLDPMRGRIQPTKIRTFDEFRTWWIPRENRGFARNRWFIAGFHMKQASECTSKVGVPTAFMDSWQLLVLARKPSKNVWEICDTTTIEWAFAVGTIWWMVGSSVKLSLVVHRRNLFNCTWSAECDLFAAMLWAR